MSTVFLFLSLRTHTITPESALIYSLILYQAPAQFEDTKRSKHSPKFSPKIDSISLPGKWNWKPTSACFFFDDFAVHVEGALDSYIA